MKRKNKMKNSVMNLIEVKLYRLNVDGGFVFYISKGNGYDLWYFPEESGSAVFLTYVENINSLDFSDIEKLVSMANFETYEMTD